MQLFGEEATIKVVRLVVFCVCFSQRYFPIVLWGHVHYMYIYLELKINIFYKTIKSKYYSNLSASIGCNSAAFLAGQIHDTIQIKKVSAVANTTTSIVIETLIHSIWKLFTSCIASRESIIAKTHHIDVTTTDSIKN